MLLPCRLGNPGAALPDNLDGLDHGQDQLAVRVEVAASPVPHKGYGLAGGI